MLDDYTTAPIDERLRAMLAYLEETTLDPDSLTADDARALRNENISNDAAVEALYVCFLFNVYDRLADTLGWEVPPAAFIRRLAPMMLKHGYK